MFFQYKTLISARNKLSLIEIFRVVFNFSYVQTNVIKFNYRRILFEDWLTVIRV